MTDSQARAAFGVVHGQVIEVAPGVRRITAPNSSPHTAAGTNSYIVGSGAVALIDPGPADASHVDALLAALDGETVTHILITHHHRDHTGAARRLAAATGAPLHAAAPERVPPAQGIAALSGGEAPVIAIGDGATLGGEGWQLEAVATPGHASDHLCLALSGTGILFSGDHVMGWATTVVSPPDGSMAAYLASLDRLLARPETHYLPGHGDPIRDGHERVRALRSHRRMREAAILARLRSGDRTVADILAALYAGLDPRLANSAANSVLAHLMDLRDRGLVESDRPPSREANFNPAA